MTEEELDEEDPIVFNTNNAIIEMNLAIQQEIVDHKESEADRLSRVG